MNSKAIGFSLTRLPNKAPAPPWLSVYPWLETRRLERDGWDILLWGHGNLTQFERPEGIVIGYSDVEMDTLTASPLQNRGDVIAPGPRTCAVTNDFLGMLPVFYGSHAGVPYVSTCEECVILGLGGVTLHPARLVHYLIFQSAVGTRTLWGEIDKLYANSVLTVSANGNFSVQAQLPVKFRPISRRGAIPAIADVSERVIRRYTDPYDDVYLMLSRGKDSGMLLAHTQRPARVHARTYTSSWPYSRSEELVIAKARCRNVGISDHRIVDFTGQTYQQYFQPQIEYAGTPLASTQAYIFGANAILGSEATHWPLISGACGDITAGSGVARVMEMFEVRKTRSKRERFKLACYCHSKEWKSEAFDACVAFDAFTELTRSRIQTEWSDLWDATEGHDLGSRIDVVRLRNRGSQYITYAWGAADLWGCFVTPYLDREYVTTILSLPYESRVGCRDQKRYGAQTFPHIFPDGGVPRTAYDVSNTLNQTTVSAEALWPLVPDGSKPAHSFFVPAGIQALYKRALNHDMKCFFWLHSLQPLAWAIDKGYVK